MIRKNMILSAVIIISCMGSAVMAQNVEWVMPKKNDVGVYENQVREKYAQPVAKADKNDRLRVLQSTRNHYKVEMPEGGTVGWVEKRLVAATAKGKEFMFEEQEVMGYLDNPTPIAIIDAKRADASIELDRSFEDALKENVDRNTVERQAE